MGDGQSQKAWLSAMKKQLSARYPGLTWDDFASLLAVDPHVFKTYRLSTAAAGFAPLPHG